MARFRSDWAHLEGNSTPSAISPSPSYLCCLNIFKHLITRISDIDSFQFLSKFCYQELLKDTATKPIVPIQWSVGAISPSPSYLCCLNIFKHLITRISDIDSFQFLSKFCYQELLKDTATKPIVPTQWSVGAISPSPSYLCCLNIFKHLITRISDIVSFHSLICFYPV